MNEIVLFEDGELKLEVQFNQEKETVWLSANQMAILFERDEKTIRKHINNVFSDKEVDESTNTQKMRVAGVTQPVKYYTLDVIISVGYRVKSQKGILFRKWANQVLKDYMLNGVAINQKRLEALNKTVEIQSRMLASTLNMDTQEVLEVVNQYTDALSLLDDYDHQSLHKPVGNTTLYQISYDECRKIIDSMKKDFDSDVFGVEKEKGKLNGILLQIYQHVFGKELYPSIEEKAANLLYFLIKDHPFADGCKRIAASLFLEFLNRNRALFKDGRQIVSNNALVAITLMVAESNPDEKEIIVMLIMNMLK